MWHVYTRRLFVFTSFSEILFLKILPKQREGKETFNLKIHLAGNCLLRRTRAPRAGAISPQWLPSIKMLSVPDRHTRVVLNFGSMQHGQCLSKVHNFFALSGFCLFFSWKASDNYQHEWTWPPPFISCVWGRTDSITQPLFSLWILPMAIKIETISSTVELTPLDTFIQRWGCQKTAKSVFLSPLQS